MAYVDYCNVRTGTLEKWKSPDQEWKVIPELSTTSYTIQTTNKAWFYDRPIYYRLSTGIIQIAVSLRKQTEMEMSTEEYERLVSQFQNTEPRLYVNFGIKTKVSLEEVRLMNPEFEFQKEKFEVKDQYFYPIRFNSLSEHQLETLIAAHQLAKGETKFDPGKVRGCFFVKEMTTPTWVFIYRIYTKATSITKLSLQFSIEFVSDSRRVVTQDPKGEFTASEFYALALFNTKIFFPPIEIFARPYRNPEKRKHHKSSLEESQESEEEEEETEPRKRQKVISTSSEILLNGLENIPSSRPVERMLLYEINAKQQELQKQLTFLHENYWKLQKEQNTNFQKFTSVFNSAMEEQQLKLDLIDSHCKMTESFFESMSTSISRLPEDVTRKRRQILPPPIFYEAPCAFVSKSQAFPHLTEPIGLSASAVPTASSVPTETTIEAEEAEVSSQLAELSHSQSEPSLFNSMLPSREYQYQSSDFNY